MLTLKRRLFSKYDETDTLKRMTDADILAEKKRKTGGYGTVAKESVKGAALGAAGLGLAGTGFAFRKGGPLAAGAGGKKLGKFAGKAGKVAGRYGAIGAAAGALIGGGIALHKRNQKAKENEFYNDRLERAQRHARRREKADWRTNMTQREGYTY
jgi:hypothetical protein